MYRGHQVQSASATSQYCKRFKTSRMHTANLISIKLKNLYLIQIVGDDIPSEKLIITTCIIYYYISFDGKQVSDLFKHFLKSSKREQLFGIRVTDITIMIYWNGNRLYSRSRFTACKLLSLV
jgi:hypothetical protein